MSFTETHQPCPECEGSDCASYREDGSWYCHGGCGGVNHQPKERKQVEITSGKFEDVRGIPAKVCEFYGILVHYSGEKPVRYAFKYPNNIKYRDFSEKKFWFKEGNKGNQDLFGPNFNAGSSKRLYITEGEFDAASLYYAMGQTFPVLSIPSAGVGEKFLKANHAYLSSFQEIVWAGDNDEPGKKAAAKLYAAFPDKFYYVPMSKYKDANEFLQNGDKEELMWAARKPLRWTPENFYMTEKDFENIFNEPSCEATVTGIEELDEKCGGIVKGFITLLLAQEGIGKSNLCAFFEACVLSNNPDAKIAACHLEESRSIVVGRLASYVARANLQHLKNDDKKKEEALKALSNYYDSERLIIFDMLSEESPYDILNHIRVLKTVYGCDYIFIDHIHQVADQDTGTDEDERRVLDKLSSRIARLCRDLNIAVVLVSHVNDDGKTRSSRMIRKQAGVVLDLTRDTESESMIDRNTTHIKISKNRPFGELGPAGTLFYDSETGTLSPGGT